eukprot:m.80482 g.80482  ORF g.80482 m.80482 type:complete len:624 (-) comp12759_c0_seq4:89-1960(-)
MSQFLRPLLEIITYNLPVVNEYSTGGLFEVDNTVCDNRTWIAPDSNSVNCDFVAMLNAYNDSTAIEAMQMQRIQLIGEKINELKDHIPPKYRDMFATIGAVNEEQKKQYKTRNVCPYKFTPGSDTFGNQFLGMNETFPAENVDYEELGSNTKYTNTTQAFLNIKFQGWMQSRMATDPDPTDATRGLTGHTFAYAKEPNLDRYLYMQENVTDGITYAPVRQIASHGKFGVTASLHLTKKAPIKQANCARDTLDQVNCIDTEIAYDLNDYQDCQVDLINNPTFVGYNGYVNYEPAETIDPFILVVSCNNTVILNKSICGIPVLKMTPGQQEFNGRRGSRYGTADFQEIQGLENYKYVWDILRDRLHNLQANFTKSPSGAVNIFDDEKQLLLFQRIVGMWAYIPMPLMHADDALRIASSQLKEMQNQVKIKNINKTAVTQLITQLQQDIQRNFKLANSCYTENQICTLNNFNVSHDFDKMGENETYENLITSAVSYLKGDTGFEKFNQSVEKLISDTENLVRVTVSESMSKSATRDIRYARYTEEATYYHSVSGATTEFNAALSDTLARYNYKVAPEALKNTCSERGDKAPFDSRFLAVYNMGVYDTDLLQFYTHGDIYIPMYGIE